MPRALVGLQVVQGGHAAGMTALHSRQTHPGPGMTALHSRQTHHAQGKTAFPQGLFGLAKRKIACIVIST